MPDDSIGYSGIPMSVGQSILLQMSKMIEIRRYYEDGLWRDITRFVNPRREDISDSSRYNMKGQRFGKDVYDGTPKSALAIWADGMQGFLVSESLNWFRSEMDNSFLNDNDNVRLWLQDYDRAMYSAFRKGNFYSILGEWFRDSGSIGTATLYTEEDINNKSSVHTVVHPREAFIAENKFGEVDTVFRKFEQTARQMVQDYGYENLSLHAKQDARDHPMTPHTIIHAVFPNDDRFFGKKTNRGKPIRSVHIEEKSGSAGDPGSVHVLRDGGHSIDPYAVWRFRKNSDEIYGRSPAADALTEIISLNQLGKTMIQAAQKSVDPSLNVPVEMRGNVRITPHGYNYYQDPKRIITPVNQSINYPFGIDQQERLQKLLEDKYRVEFFLTLSRAEREMTATEIMERQSEKAVLMGPQVERLFQEGIKKVFNIVSFIEDRAGRLPDPDDYDVPDEFYEDSININLTGPLPQAQKRLFRMQPIRNTINELAPLAAIKPEVLDVVNWDELSEIIVESGAFPQKAMNSKQVREKIRADRAAEAARQQQMQMLQGAAEAYPNLTQKPESGSPAEAMSEAL